jgi:hypothetical protein
MFSPSTSCPAWLARKLADFATVVGIPNTRAYGFNRNLAHRASVNRTISYWRLSRPDRAWQLLPQRFRAAATVDDRTVMR